MPQPSRGPTVELVPGFPDNLCLSFANTRYYRGTEPPTETLGDLNALLSWCRSSAGLSAARERALWRAWREEAAGAAALGEALDLRELFYRIFFSSAEGRAPGASDLDAVNRALQAAPDRLGIARAGSGFAWRVAQAAEPSIPALLAPVTWSAADLLTGPRLARVRHCANERCLWLFLDDSKSGTRRWCSMSACGNRAKAHRHYVRHRQD